MKKFLMMFAAMLFSSALFTGEARAQLPLPGQSVPVIDNIYVTEVDDGGVTMDTIGFYHHGNSVDYSPGYFLWMDTWVNKRNANGTWSTMYSGSFYNYCSNHSAEDPNLTTFSRCQQALSLAYGNGVYKIGINVYAYDPLTHVKIFITQVSTSFGVYY